MTERTGVIILGCVFPFAIAFSYLYGLWHNSESARYAAYANHCAIQKKVPESFHTWRKARRGISS